MLCLAAATPAVAGAQSLQRLTVQSFVLTADTAAPRIETPFHLIVTLRVRERVTQIYNLDLPILAQLELLGDERATSTGPHGTQYRETITVVAHNGGPLAIAPATLQAIDARDGKAKEWYTNALALHVSGGTSQTVGRSASAAFAAVRGLVRFFFMLLVWVLAVGSLAALVVLLFRRRPAVKAPPAPPATPPLPARSRRQEAQDALLVLRAQRSRQAAVAVRASIWRMAGASDGETLSDVLRRPGCGQEPMRGLLIALERSAFTFDDDLRAAIDDACSALERYIGSAP